MFILGQDIVPQQAVYLHVLPSFPFQRYIPYFTKESNAFFSSGRQEPVKGWAWSSIVACKLFIVMSDPGCMYLLFPESEGSFLHGTSWAALVGRWSRNCLGVRLLGMDSRSTESKADRGNSKEGVEVQQETIYTGTGMWRSPKFSYYSVGQHFWPAEKGRWDAGAHLQFLHPRQSVKML